MSVAFGIEYGLADITRANEAISRELEAQKRLYDDMSARARGLGYGSQRPAFQLGAGPSVDSNVIDRRFDERIDASLDRRIRREKSRFAGTSGGGGLHLRGAVNDLRGTAALVNGDFSFYNAMDAVSLAKHIPGAEKAALAFGRALPVVGGVVAGAVAMNELLQYGSKPSAKTEEYQRRATAAWAKMDKLWEGTGDTLHLGQSFGFDLPKDFRSHQSSNVLLLGKFDKQIEEKLLFRSEFVEAATELYQMSPKQAFAVLGMTGRPNRAVIRQYVNKIVDSGDGERMLDLRLSLKRLKDRTKREKFLAQSQELIYEEDAIAESRAQSFRRADKWRQDRDAKALQDWSRS